MMLNTPLKNKKFSINSMTMASFANSNGYINEEKNTNRNLILSERGGIDFRSSYLDLGVNGNIRYNATSNSLQKENNQNTFNYGAGGYTTIYLPLNFKIRLSLVGSEMCIRDRVHQLWLRGRIQTERSPMECLSLQVFLKE